MAKATTVIRKMEVDPEEKRKEDLRELEDVLLDNKEGITDLLKLLQRFQHKEVFHMAESMLGQSDKILERVVISMDHPEVTQSIKNMLLLAQALGKLKMDELEPVIHKVNAAVENIAEYEHNHNKGSYLSILSTLKDKEVMQGMNVMLALVKGFGIREEDGGKESIDENERPARLSDIPERDRPDTPSHESNPQKSSKWVYFIGGAVAVAVPLLFRKRQY
ncbi:DUF1641 domain-containing protein [Cytobacillus purgationiresistens]|uniref:Uncharacterized protein YjgD (DUF1641 family) n=1 Tax=Cytobacillus purgationiresistens TaxID=863449 RepID=A0ABU0AGZ6_9BACI|nr:hypothetical protein [Cytobacillus purgationiresistens]MDQ0270536.1 uncharacterized protein YjgD (DUF1641 family) [Cytobacillus purgationiresistens]